MKKYLKFMVLFFILILSGCTVTQPPLYKWGNYVKTSTEYGMNPQDKELSQLHLAELKKIIDESTAEDKRVAPGIYSEYAQMLFELGKHEEAKKYFILEKNTYVESTVFINRVLFKLYGEKYE